MTHSARQQGRRRASNVLNRNDKDHKIGTGVPQKDRRTLEAGGRLCASMICGTARLLDTVGEPETVAHGVRSLQAVCESPDVGVDVRRAVEGHRTSAAPSKQKAKTVHAGFENGNHVGARAKGGKKRASGEVPRDLAVDDFVAVQCFQARQGSNGLQRDACIRLKRKQLKRGNWVCT